MHIHAITLEKVSALNINFQVQSTEKINTQV